MAGPNRPKKSKSSTSREREAGAEKKPEKGAGPRDSTPPLAPAEGMRNWLVPGLLTLAVGGVFLWSRSANRAPAEPPPSVQPAPSTQGSAVPAPAPAPVPPPAPPPPPAPAPPPPPQGEDPSVRPVHPTPDSPDPRHGDFSLAAATAGLPAGPNLVAEIETSMGSFQCQLWPDRAPNTVANFVGLARGLRDFWDPTEGHWVRRPYYDGSVFHRVIPEFMIQGGDILRSGQGGPGYEIRDENVAQHNEAGLLCMANHGPHTNGSQFFILEVPKEHLNGSYSVFGRCTPTDLVNRIARVDRNARDRPLVPVTIRHVRVHR